EAPAGLLVPVPVTLRDARSRHPDLPDSVRRAEGRRLRLGDDDPLLPPGGAAADERSGGLAARLLDAVLRERPGVDALHHRPLAQPAPGDEQGRFGEPVT